jgi:acyl dehydratase
MASNVYFEDIEVGQRIPPFVRTTDLMNWNRFAAVNDEFLFVHMDDDAGKAAGQGAAFGMGNLRWAYVLNALRDWLGDDAEILELNMQFRAINHKNDVLTASGVVTEKSRREGANIVRLTIDVTNQDGAATAPGYAVVSVPARAR